MKFHQIFTQSLDTAFNKQFGKTIYYQNKQSDKLLSLMRIGDIKDSINPDEENYFQIHPDSVYAMIPLAGNEFFA